MNIQSVSPAGARGAATQVNLVAEVSAQLSASTEYQIIRRVLLAPDEAAEGKAAAGGEPPAVTEAPEAAASAESPETALQQIVEQRAAAVSLSVNVSVSVSVSVQVQAGQQVQKSDPLVLDLDGNGFRTTGIANGARFDIDNDGVLDQVSVAAGGDAFVALDRNRNGIIDHGGELFGDQHGDANGFEALRRYDGNGDGVIDAGDAVFDDLTLLSFAPDGSQRLVSLREAGVRAISLDYVHKTQAVNRHDTLAQLASFVRDDGRVGAAGDLLLGSVKA